MAMKLLAARDLGTEYRLIIHLDDSKVTDGEPDPAWVMVQRWMRAPGLKDDGTPLMTAAQWRQAIQREGKALAEAELARRQAATSTGTVIAGFAEGSVL